MYDESAGKPIPSRERVEEFLGKGWHIRALPIAKKPEGIKLLNEVGYHVEPYIPFVGRRSKFSRRKMKNADFGLVATIIAGETVRLKTQWPNLDLTGVIIDPNNPSTPRGTVAGRAMSPYAQVGGEVTGMPRYLQIKPGDALSDEIPEDRLEYALKYFPEVATTTFSRLPNEPEGPAIFRHELAHTIATRYADKSVALFRDSIVDYSMLFQWREVRVSRYATSSHGELLAEVFSIYTSPNYSTLGEGKVLHDYEGFPVYTLRIANPENMQIYGDPVNAALHKKLAYEIGRPPDVIADFLVGAEMEVFIHPAKVRSAFVYQGVPNIELTLVNEDRTPQFLPRAFEIICEDMISMSYTIAEATKDPNNEYRRKWADYRQSPTALEREGLLSQWNASVEAPPPGMKYVISPDLSDKEINELMGEEIESYLILVEKDNFEFKPFLPEDPAA